MSDKTATAYPVTWFEIVGKDGARLRGFYGELFGWKAEIDNPLNYGVVNAAGEGISGGIGELAPLHKAGIQAQSWLTVYVRTPDVQATLDRAKALGGRVAMPPATLPDGMVIAALEDPEGHLIGVLSKA